jgi:glycosyltransferase involved in cell wall biosynthesis
MPGKRARNNKKRHQQKVGNKLPSQNQLKKLKPNEKFPLPEVPFVSICTPTFNRRPFIPYLIKCIEAQDYPQDKIEWVVIDDGTDPIEDIVSDLSYCKYFKYDTKMSLGKKRNLMHAKSTGDVIVYMDDDDYYPPERVSHAVEVLKKNKRALAAGSSRIHLFFKHIQKVYEFGPYGPQHATAGTFALKRQILNYTRYDDDRALAEEKKFLHDYQIPLVQLEPEKTIFVFSHEHNTFDKRKLLENPNPKLTKEISLTPKDYIKDDGLFDFYINKVDDMLKEYEPGLPKHKPDVIEQTERLTKEREELKAKMMEQEKARINSQPITIKDAQGKDKQLTHIEVIQLLQQLQSKLKETTQLCQQLQSINNTKDTKIRELESELESVKSRQTIDATYVSVKSSDMNGKDENSQTVPETEEITISISGEE